MLHDHLPSSCSAIIIIIKFNYYYLGPYYCAEGQLTNALVRCMTSPATIDVKVLEDKMRGFAASGDIDDTNNIKGDKVYLYSGTKDTVVDPGKDLDT